MSREEDNDQPSIAELRAAIQREHDAAQRGLTGFAEVAKHEFITKHMENMSKAHEQLKEIDEGADQFLIEVLDSGDESEQMQRLLEEFNAVPSYFERYARKGKEARDGKAKR